MDFATFFKKRIEPFIALAVLIVLIILAFQLYSGNKLRIEISQNCGWEDENYRCFCKKSDALFIQNTIYGIDPIIDEVEYVQVDR